MDKRWQVSEDGTTWTREVTVTNGAKVTISQSRDLDAGQIFFRSKLNTALEFGGSDYLYFLGFERRPSGRCQSLFIRCQLKCASNWSTLWTGEFSTGSGKWDLGRCLFEVKPETVDKYQCILRKQDAKVNVLNTDVVEAAAVVLPVGMEVTVRDVSLPPLSSPGWDLVDTQSISRPAMGICGADTSTYEIYWRETTTTTCIDGTPVVPAGAGWAQEISSFCSDGFVKWARAPSAAWPFPNDPIVLGPVATSGNPLLEPTSPACTAWFRADIFACPGGFRIGYYLCLDTATPNASFPSGRTLENAVDLIVDTAACDLEGMRSDFFGWNAPGTAPGYVAGENYVTGETTQTEDILIFQKTDVIYPSASNPATIGEMTFKEMMTTLRVMFDCYWDIDSQGYIRIEHWSYWVEANGLNLTTLAKTDEPLVYEHLKDKIPGKERLTFMEAFSRDFVGKDIVYSGPCVTGDGDGAVQNISPGKITTDVGLILSDPTAVSKDGFVLMSTVFDGSVYNAILDTGAITNTYVTNAPLSTANLMRDFWTWTRYLPTGNMNGADVTFDGFRPNIEQQSVRLKLCCETLYFDARDKITSALGERLGGLPATVEEVTYDLFIDSTELTLRYSY